MLNIDGGWRLGVVFNDATGSVTESVNDFVLLSLWCRFCYQYPLRNSIHHSYACVPSSCLS